MHEIVSALGERWVATVVLLTVRIAAVLLLTPLLHAVSMPVLFRVLLVAGLACVIALPFGSTSATVPTEAGAFAAAVLREAAVGATLGLGILMGFAGFRAAGQLLDIQMGFGMAQLLDPAQGRASVLSATLGLLGAVFFFLVDGHHAVLRGVAYSVERFPLGAGWPGSAAAAPIAGQMAALFGLGFALAAPVVLALLLVEFALGTVSRNLPQMNMLAMGLPVKILVGLFALSMWTTAFQAPARQLYAGIYKTWILWFDGGQR
jgi:flagellar biosynthetic protein FliR